MRREQRIQGWVCHVIIRKEEKDEIDARGARVSSSGEMTLTASVSI